MIIDLLFLGSIIYGVYKGAQMGAFSGAVSILKLVLSALLAFRFGAHISYYVSKFLKLEMLAVPIVSFFIAWALCFLALTGIGIGLTRIFGLMNLDIVSKHSGGITMALLLSMLFSGGLNIADRNGFVLETMKSQSVTYPYIKPIMPIFRHQLGRTLPSGKDPIDSMTDHFRDVRDAAEAYEYERKEKNRTEYEKDRQRYR